MDYNRDKWHITPGFAICWLVIIIIQGAHFGSDKKSMRKMWQRPPYGISIPYVQNTMQRDAFEFMRRHIHFADNCKRPKTADKNYDPLFKVTYVLKEVGLGIRRVWHGMLNTVSWYFLRSRVLESQSGRNTGTKIRGDMISKLISGYLFSTTASALTGMENHVTDLATCEKAPSSLVNARCVSFV